MKKMILSVAAVAAIVGGSFAQKATLDNPWSLEGVINYSGTGGVNWKAPTIRARYFVNDNIAARVQLGLGDGLGTPMSEAYTFNAPDPGPNAGQTGSFDINRMAWNAQIGGEYHLSGTDRLSPYFALGINFGGGSSKASSSDAATMPGDAGSEDPNDFSFAKDVSIEQEGGFSMFGLGLGAGLDVYVMENLYLGLELGLNFSSYNYKESIYKVTSVTGSTTTITENVSNGYKKSYLSTGAMNAAFRLGWRF